MHTGYFGTNTLTNLGPTLWELVPDKIKIFQRSNLVCHPSNLGLKLEPLTTILTGSVKHLLQK